MRFDKLSIFINFVTILAGAGKRRLQLYFPPTLFITSYHSGRGHDGSSHDGWVQKPILQRHLVDLLPEIDDLEKEGKVISPTKVVQMSELKI